MTAVVASRPPGNFYLTHSISREPSQGHSSKVPYSRDLRWQYYVPDSWNKKSMTHGSQHFSPPVKCDPSSQPHEDADFAKDALAGDGYEYASLEFARIGQDLVKVIDQLQKQLAIDRRHLHLMHHAGPVGSPNHQQFTKQGSTSCLGFIKKDFRSAQTMCQAQELQGTENLSNAQTTYPVQNLEGMCYHSSEAPEVSMLNEMPHSGWTSLDEIDEYQQLDGHEQYTSNSDGEREHAAEAPESIGGERECESADLEDDDDVKIELEQAEFAPANPEIDPEDCMLRNPDEDDLEEQFCLNEEEVESQDDSSDGMPPLINQLSEEDVEDENLLSPPSVEKSEPASTSTACDDNRASSSDGSFRRERCLWADVEDDKSDCPEYHFDAACETANEQLAENAPKASESKRPEAVPESKTETDCSGFETVKPEQAPIDPTTPAVSMVLELKTHLKTRRYRDKAHLQEAYDEDQSITGVTRKAPDHTATGFSKASTSSNETLVGTAPNSEEIKMLLGGTWIGTRGESYEINLKTWICSKANKDVSRVHTYKLKLEDDLGIVYWQSCTFMLHLGELKSNPDQAVWRSVSDGVVRWVWAKKRQQPRIVLQPRIVGRYAKTRAKSK